jgi:hypothetical protein
MVSGAALKDLSLLSRFFVIAFADLKKYHYYYWFAFPSFATDLITIVKTESIKDCWNEKQVAHFRVFPLFFSFSFLFFPSFFFSFDFFIYNLNLLLGDTV